MKNVLKRPEHRLAHGLKSEAIDEFLAELAALTEPVEVHFQWRPQTKRRAGKATGEGLMRFLRTAPTSRPEPEDIP